MDQNKTTSSGQFTGKIENRFETLNMPSWFEDSVKQYKRFITKPVKVGNLIIGNGESIKVQSMTNTDTMKTDITVDQIKRLIDVGCDIARITVPNLNDAKNLAAIKSKLIAGGYTIPIVADVHFTPQAAMIAAELVEKVRINPGNFVDRKRFEEKTYTEADYQAELKRVEDKLIPLIEVCKKNGTAMRIGANHGSLSDRIINWYGDNPEGMVQSALEFLNICERENFDQIVFSMKSSNTLVMVAAYRLLVHRLLERGTLYPVHLGVTEAGDDEDGRAKSAFGIGALLLDGIGDTIRVSLTEDPEKEIPVAKKILQSVERFLAVPEESKSITKVLEEKSGHALEKVINPFDFSRTKTFAVGSWGGATATQVLFSPGFPLVEKSDLAKLGLEEIKATDKWNTKLFCPDLIYVNGKTFNPELAFYIKEAGQQVLVSVHSDHKKTINDAHIFYPSYTDYINSTEQPSERVSRVVQLGVADFGALKSAYEKNPKQFEKVIFVIGGKNTSSLRTIRYLVLALKAIGVQQPLALSLNGYSVGNPFKDVEEHKIAQSLYLAHLLVDGLLDGIQYEEGTTEELKYLFSILQASRQRISKPEYISCPSCGRTLFDLQEVTAKVKKATNHLVGVKIAVMGCIVNGPGEMADADFGYVGSGPGKITLYKGKEIRVRGVESEHAVERLVTLIKEEGFWQEPQI